MNENAKNYVNRNPIIDQQVTEAEEKESEKRLLQVRVPTVEKSHSVKEGMFQFLHVPMAIDLDVLKKEIRAGAKHFRSLLSLLNDNAGRFVIIDADNQEEGLLAAAFAYAIQREQDVRNAMEDSTLYDTEDAMWIDEEDVESKNLVYLSNSLEYLPLVRGDEAISWTSRARCGMREVFPFGNSMVMGQEASVKQPFWLELGDKPLLLLITQNELNCFNAELLAESIRYFENSTHVYILVIRDEEPAGREEEEDEDEDIPSEPVVLETEPVSELTRLILELTGDFVSVRICEAERKIYRQCLMKSWLKAYEFTEWEGGLEWLVDSVTRLNRECVSEYMEKMLKLVRKHYPEQHNLTREMLRKLGILEVSAASVSGVSLDSLVGMNSVKQQILSVLNVLKFRRQLRLHGRKGGVYHNVFLFQGAPGTAKTTVARAFGRLLIEAKLLRKDRFVSVTGSQLKAPYLGQTSGLVHKLFQNNDIILIDEAYALAPKMQGEIDLYASEALAQLAVELENHAMDKVVIFAGYGGDAVSGGDDKMSEFLETNPGIRSRINFTITFPSYTPANMLEIVHFMAKEQELGMVHTADREITRYFETRCGDRTFGNGREARSFIENAVRIAAERYAEDFPEDGNVVLTKKDILRTIRFMQEKTGNTGIGSAAGSYGLIPAERRD